MGSPKWLLISTLNPETPTVVAVGDAAKRCVPLSSILRPADRCLAAAAVRTVCRTGVAVASDSGGKVVAVDPISDDDSGLVHAVWLRIGYTGSAVPFRPSAWAFVWDLDSAVAKRSAMVSSFESWASLGVDRSRSVADGLSRLDLGSNTASVLARLVSGAAKSVLQVQGVERRPRGENRIIQVVAQFYPPANSSGIKGLVRGVSVDLGSAQGDRLPGQCRQRSLDELVARAMSKPNEYRAVVDPDTLALLSWYGDAPESLAWRRLRKDGERPKPVLHPDDVPLARSIAQTLRQSVEGHQEAVTLRFLNRNSAYVPVAVAARMIALDLDVQAILCVLTLQHESNAEIVARCV